MANKIRRNFFLDEDLFFDFKSETAKKKKKMSPIVERLIKDYCGKIK